MNGTKNLLLCSLLFSAFLFISTGCGTYHNVKAAKHPNKSGFAFGGVVRDLGLIGGAFLIFKLEEATEDEEEIENCDQCTHKSRCEEHEDDSGSDLIKLLGFFAIFDLPLSFVGDIVTLPYVLSDGTSSTASDPE